MVRSLKKWLKLSENIVNINELINYQTTQENLMFTDEKKRSIVKE